MHKHLFFVLFLWVTSLSSAQVIYPQNYFDSPLHMPISLSGNFGEIRPNHFHAGFDIRTKNKEGLPVYAVADGFVSRIKISAIGYGKALYITHPNGFVSVYGHLNGFNVAIQAKAKALQYELESFELDTLLNPERLPVKKGDLIGFTGNTGGSQAPHLHFEIRNEITEMPVNPYCFGYKVEDTVAPGIASLIVYPLGASSTVNGKHAVKKIIPHKVNGAYQLAKIDSLTLSGEIGFGINCYDRENAGSGTNNVYSIEMQAGGKRLFYYAMEAFTFDNARYVNAHIDYAEKQKTHQLIQKCFLSKNNILEIYKDVVNRGIVNFNDDADHWITFIIKDYVGNTTQLALKVKSKPSTNVLSSPPVANLFDCLKDNTFSKPGIDLQIPAAALYDDLIFSYKKSPALKGSLSPVYHLGTESIPLQKPVIISLAATAIPNKWKEKACIVSLTATGKWSYEGGIYTDDKLISESKHFGKFAIVLDTLPPKIVPLLKLVKTDSIQDFRFLKALKFKATDNLSGVEHYRATIDSHWVICEYDEKNDLLFYTFDDSIQSGVHEFKLEVTDDKDNKKEWKIRFRR